MIELKEAITALVDKDVEFVLIGGVAVRLQSSAYVTEDLDLCYARNHANLINLVQALQRFSPRPRDVPKDLPFIFDEKHLAKRYQFYIEHNNR